MQICRLRIILIIQRDVCYRVITITVDAFANMAASLAGIGMDVTTVGAVLPPLDVEPPPVLPPPPAAPPPPVVCPPPPPFEVVVVVVAGMPFELDEVDETSVHVPQFSTPSSWPAVTRSS
jgi:hypothetical protein